MLGNFAPKTHILLILSLSIGIHLYSAVLDPDLEITAGGGVGVGERLVSKKKVFWPFEPQSGLKIGGVPPGPSPGSATVLVQQIILHVVHMVKSAYTRSR